MLFKSTIIYFYLHLVLPRLFTFFGFFLFTGVISIILTDWFIADDIYWWCFALSEFQCGLEGSCWKICRCDLYDHGRLCRGPIPLAGKLHEVSMAVEPPINLSNWVINCRPLTTNYDCFDVTVKYRTSEHSNHAHVLFQNVHKDIFCYAILYNATKRHINVKTL